MTRLVMSGFEGGSNSFEQWTLTAPDPTYDTVIKRSGVRSLKWIVSGATGGYAYWAFTGATARTYFARVYMYITALPTDPVDQVNTLFFSTTADAALVSLNLGGDGKMYVRDENNGADVGDSGAVILSTGQWYMLDLAVKINTGSNDDYVEARINGVSFYSSTTLNLGTAAPGRIYIEAFLWNFATSTYTLNYDDLAMNDSQGSVNNSWCGSENIIVLKPVSDNARGANWTAGAGGTSNLWQAVDNTPPVGVANASATDTSQIKNAASDTTGNYDANITDYITGGVGASDTINAVQGIWDVGCSSATSTSGATHVVSNPAEGAETSINFAVSGAVGTWTSNWKRQYNAIIEAPSVTKGTQPVLRIGKRQATTRIGHCGFMGLMVGYTPGTAITIKFQKASVLGV